MGLSPRRAEEDGRRGPSPQTGFSDAHAHGIESNGPNYDSRCFVLTRDTRYRAQACKIGQRHG